MGTAFVLACTVLTACNADALSAADEQRVEEFRQVAFRPDEPRSIIYTAPQHAQQFIIDGACYQREMDQKPFSRRARMGSAIGDSSTHLAGGYFRQPGMMKTSTTCLPDTFQRTRARLIYFTSPEAYATALAERQRDPRFNIRAAQPQRPQNGCAIFMEVRDHLVRRTDALILAPPGKALDIDDKPGVACAIRAATAALGMMGMLDLDDERLLAPNYRQRYEQNFPMLYRPSFGHWLFWNVKLEPGMSEADAVAAVRASAELRDLRDAKLAEGAQK